MRLSALVLLPLCLGGAELLVPGAPSLDPSRIREGTDSLVVMVVQGDQISIAGRMVFGTRRVGDVVGRTERMSGLEGVEASVDSFALDARTLSPTYRVAAGHEIRTPGKAFHPNSVDLVLAALPLAEGYAAELALETEGADLAPTASVSVHGTESIRLPSGETCPSWSVRVTIGDQTGLYLLSMQSHALVRYVSRSDGQLLNRIRGCGEA